MNTRTLDVALRISADLDQAAAEVAALDANFDGLKTSAQGAAQGLNAAATAAGKNTAADQANATAAKAAATSQTALGAATQKTAAIQQKGAISAAQHAQAMRQLPMQITDIVTGLASGQSVFMVAIQQGGQLKDSFGGVAPAARALLGAVSPMAIAVTAGAAAFAVLGLALHEVYQEQEAVTNALLTTGNYVGASVQQVDSLARSMAALDGVTEGGAREALLAVAQSGRIAGDQFERVATAAARMEEATGQSIDTTVQKFEAIAKDPVSALLKLNETEHFLTEAQLERVRALVEEGREQDAAAAGARIYADRLDEIATAADAARPHLAQLWREMKKGASEAWEGTKNVVEFLAAAADKQREMPWYQRMGPGAAIGTVRALYGATPTIAAPVSPVAGAVDSDAERKKEEEKKKREQEHKSFMAAESRYLDDAARKKLELAAVEDLLTRKIITGEEAVKRRAQIEDSYARKASKKGEKTDAAKAEESAQRELESLTKQAALLGTVAEGENRVSEEARVRYETESGAYKLASASVKQQLIDQAKLLDAKRAEREEEEKRKRAFDDAKRNYERLRDSLETPVEAAVADIKAKIDALNEAMAKGVPIAGGYQEALRRIFNQGYTEAPKLPGNLDQNDTTGLLGDQSQLDGYLQKLNEWYSQQQAIIATGRASNAALNAEWDAQEERARTEHANRVAALQAAQKNLQLSAAQSIFDSMTQIAYNAAGEQSRAYQVLFAISKGFAIAQAAINLARSVSEASAQPWPTNLPAIANAFAQGAQIAAMIAGASYRPGGYADGGYTGPGGKYEPRGIVHAGEGVLSQEDMRALGGERGFYALRHAIHNGYADGGVVTPADYDAGGFGGRLAELPQTAPAKLQSDMTLYLLQDRDALARSLARHPAMRKAIVAEVSENGNAIQMSWGG